jgi:spore germination cell wall hydrolase CwlJ-like protein
MAQKRLTVSRSLRMPANAVFAGALLMLSASCVPGGAALAPARLSDSFAGSNAAALPATPPPAPQPLLLQEVAPDTAVALNAAIPVTAGYNPPARSFTIAPAAFSARMRSIECLTAAIYYEAASESDDGQRAVAQVVLNRVRHPTYPNSVCGVVYQGSERSTGCQFSFTCDGTLARVPSIAGWARARRIAAAALSGSVYAPVGYSTHYHTYQVLPYWAASLAKTAVIGAHIFYRWNGGWGTPAAFRQRYAGAEPLPGPKPRQIEAAPLPSTSMLKAELAALLKVSTQAELAGMAAVRTAAPAPDAPGTNLPKVNYTGAGLPESTVLEAYRYSGVPRDQLPGAARAAAD